MRSNLRFFLFFYFLTIDIIYIKKRDPKIQRVGTKLGIQHPGKGTNVRTTHVDSALEAQCQGSYMGTLCLSSASIT